MLEFVFNAFAALYALSSLWLAVYGLNGIILVALYWWHRQRPFASVPDIPREALPSVTLQLPLYNERHVAERLIDAVVDLDYPSNRLQIQVLDDSDDETVRLVDARVARYQERGVDIQVVRRADREGFKAGALAHAMPQAKGDLIAIFDADFRPKHDFLLRSVPYLVDDPGLGVVQARWSYINSEYSPLTRLQSLALDGHFVVEQDARSRSGLLMHFNGTAGVWRRECIEDSGGWESDTLCEDLDLSYRAQIEGWRLLYLPQVEGPSELPPQILAFKRQQDRWACGSVQCLRKLTGPVLRCGHFSGVQKIMALIHLSSYLAYPLMIGLLLLTLPLVLHPHPVQGWLQLLAPMCIGPLAVYVSAQQALYPDWKRRLLALPLMILVGTGVAWNNTRAIWRGLTQWGGEMKRTPKFQLEGRQGGWAHSRYRLMKDRSIVGELALTVFAAATAVVGWSLGRNGSLPFLLLYVGAFGAVGGLSLVDVLRRGDRRAPSRSLVRRFRKEWERSRGGWETD